MIIFVLRHGEREQEPADSLTQAGKERAKLLVRMLAESGVSIAYHSDAVRTREMLKPLAQKLGSKLTVKEVKISGPNGIDTHVQEIVNEVKSQPPEKIVVIVSHSNTVRQIIARLGAGDVAPIENNQFDKLFVLFGEPANDAVQVLRLRYGAET